MRIFEIFRKPFSSPKRGAWEDAAPLRVSGARTVMTPEPDEAELAARALLESLSPAPKNKGGGKGKEPEKGSEEHYRMVAERVREGRDEERRAALRYVAYCEEQLKGRSPQLADLEEDLYKHQAAVEREGGELKTRWLRCLGDTVFRREQAEGAKN